MTAVTQLECQMLEWRAPVEFAADHERGEIDDREFADRVLNTTDRLNNWWGLQRSTRHRPPRPVGIYPAAHIPR